MDITVLLDNYHWCLVRIVESFSKKYYYGAEFDIIGNIDVGLGPVEICDYYRTIDNIITALHNKIPKKTLLKRYDLHLDASMEGKTFINLYNYRKQNA